MLCRFIYTRTCSKGHKNNQHHAPVKPSHDEIAKRAYNLFSASGYIPGHDIENWCRAEAQITAASEITFKAHG